MTKDIQAINANDIPHKVILCDSSKGIKMATKSEYNNHTSKRKNKHSISIKKTQRKSKKDKS